MINWLILIIMSYSLKNSIETGNIPMIFLDSIFVIIALALVLPWKKKDQK